METINNAASVQKSPTKKIAGLFLYLQSAYNKSISKLTKSLNS
ncbi:MAG: hypothetical protein RIR12_1658 [Bacteroidota bacterium]|jgi:hypothetical protein